jgi:aspartate ammonia-lyase
MARNEFRMEHDFLGDRAVPADAYYGIQTLRGAENFPITGLVRMPQMMKAGFWLNLSGILVITAICAFLI